MAAPYSARAYETTAINTANRNHQVVLLFDAAVRFLHQAQAGMEAGDHEAQCQGIIRAQNIISTLATSLDHSVADELCNNLFSLYNWLHNLLTEASISSDLALLGQALEIMTKLRDGWRQAEQNLRTEQKAQEESLGVQAA